jgi:hypothetical protein
MTQERVTYDNESEARGIYDTFITFGGLSERAFDTCPELGGATCVCYYPLLE